MSYRPSADEEICGETYDHDEEIDYDGPDGVQWSCRNCGAEGWEPRETEIATELRARAAELEDRVSPAIAGPRTDDERMWLEKAAALREEADRMEPTHHTTEQ